VTQIRSKTVITLTKFSDEFKGLFNQLLQQNSMILNMLKMLINYINKKNKFLRIAQWNANGLQNLKEETKLFLKQNFIDILLISETHFTTKNYFSIARYKLYYTNNPDGTAHGGTAILTNETIEHY
jgi:hypothetical protein